MVDIYITVTHVIACGRIDGITAIITVINMNCCMVDAMMYMSFESVLDLHSQTIIWEHNVYFCMLIEWEIHR